MYSNIYSLIILLTFLLIISVIILIAVGLCHETRAIAGGVDIMKDIQKYPASGFENYIRGKIELITGRKFPTVLPDWLIYRGRRMELDGYNEELGIAFEAQGPQHTMYSREYYSDYLQYYRRVMSDEAKLRLANEYGVGLIIIDYKVPKYMLDRYIRSRIYDICRDKLLSGGFARVNCEALGYNELNILIKPYWYAEKIIHNPYRNYVIERELAEDSEI